AADGVAVFIDEAGGGGSGAFAVQHGEAQGVGSLLQCQLFGFVLVLGDATAAVRADDFFAIQTPDRIIVRPDRQLDAIDLFIGDDVGDAEVGGVLRVGAILFGDLIQIDREFADLGALPGQLGV